MNPYDHASQAQKAPATAAWIATGRGLQLLYVVVLACIASIIAGIVLTGCGQNQIEWSEQVKLQSGEIVVVKRTAKSKPFGEVGGPGGWENDGMTLHILEPQKPDNPPLWDARYVPLLFDREPVSGQWFVVATFYSCTSWYELGKPALPYTEFRFKDGKWTQGPLTPSLIGREGNMLTSIRSKGEPNHTLQSKEDAMSDVRISPTYKRIVSSWRTSC
jgi:hypothetical protein